MKILCGAVLALMLSAIAFGQEPLTAHVKAVEIVSRMGATSAFNRVYDSSPVAEMKFTIYTVECTGKIYKLSMRFGEPLEGGKDYPVVKIEKSRMVLSVYGQVAQGRTKKKLCFKKMDYDTEAVSETGDK